MTSGEYAIIISFGSLCMAAVALGWNIYRDVIIKPRIRVKIKNSVIVHPSFKSNKKRVIISVVNYGPGKARLNSLHLRENSLWKRLLKKETNAFLIHDYEDPLSGKLPAELEVGGVLDFTFRYTDDIFFSDDSLNQIGVADPFGKTHWCKRKEYVQAKAEYVRQSSKKSQEVSR